jgi:hypothetical protein
MIKNYVTRRLKLNLRALTANSTPPFDHHVCADPFSQIILAITASSYSAIPLDIPSSRTIPERRCRGAHHYFCLG